jgi:hypothetical protein
LRLRVWDLGLRVWGLFVVWCRVQGSSVRGYRLRVFGLEVSGLDLVLGVYDVEFWV